MYEIPNQISSLRRNLKESLKIEIDEFLYFFNLIEWKEEFKFIKPDAKLHHQTAYNKFEIEVEKLELKKETFRTNEFISQNPLTCRLELT